MRTLTVTELRAALKTAPHTKDGSGLPTRDQLKAAVALVRHSQAHRKAAEAWFYVVYGQPSKELVRFEVAYEQPSKESTWATVCQAGVEPEDTAAWAAWHEQGEGWEQAVLEARELHWAEACNLNELAHEQLRPDADLEQCAVWTGWGEEWAARNSTGK